MGQGQTERDGYYYEIATVAIDGTGLNRLTESKEGKFYPAWSPDGSSLAYLRSSYSRLNPDLNGLLITSRDGSNRRQVVRWHLEQAEGFPNDIYGISFTPFVPRWSPDGRRLAVVLQEGREGGNNGVVIYTVGVDGTEVVRVSEAISQPSWSPDGSRLALARVEGDKIVLVTLARDGSDPRQVTKIAGIEERFVDLEDIYESWIAGLSWSPDGAHVMFQCDVEMLCIVNLESSVVSEVPLPELSPARIYQGNGHRAAWSPDGSRIAVRALNFPGPEPGGYPVVYTMDPDGENVEVLVRSGLAKSPQEPAMGEFESEMAACSNSIVVPQPESNPGLVRDCVALTSTRDILAKEVPLNWGTEVPMDQWDGITIGGDPSRVIGLELLWGVGIGWLAQTSWYRMEGDYKIGFGTPLPKELADLTKLQTLSLAVNEVEGTVPLELANLEDLRDLYIKWQRFWGCIPLVLSDVWVDATMLSRCEDKGQ